MWLMRDEGMTLRQAFEYMKSKRHFIRPNNKFAQELLALEFKLFGKNTITEEEMAPKTRYVIPKLE